MAESWREKRRRELQGSAQQSSSSSESWREQRRQELNGTAPAAAATPAQVKPVAPRSLPSVQNQLETATTAFTPQSTNPDLRPTFGPPKPSGLENRAAINDALPGRNIPVIGGVLKGLDKLQEYTQPASRIAEQLYTPGAGLTAIGAGTQAAGNLLSRVAPAIGRGSGLGAAIGREAIKEAAVGIPLGAGQVLANNPGASGREVAQGAAFGAGLGAVSGGALAGIGRAISSRLGRNGVQDDVIQEILALPAPKQRGNANMAQTPNIMPGFGGGRLPELPAPGPLGLPAPQIKSPTTGRIAQQTNPYRQQFEALMQRARQLQDDGRFTPGREDADLESLWSQMAGREGVSLDELIQRAYPTRTSKVNPDLVQQARSTQYSREVAGAPLPVKSMADRLISPQGTLGRAATPLERVGRSGLLPNSEKMLPKAKPSQPRIEVNPDVRKGQNKPLGRIASTSRSTYTPNNKTQGLRANYQNQLNNGNFSPELQQRIKNTDQRYDIAHNADSVAKANENVKNLTKAEADFLSNQSGGSEHIATGYRLMQELDALREHQRSLNVANKLAADLTKSGQTSQAATLISRLSPDGQLLNLVRSAERNGMEVSAADSAKFKQLAAIVQDNTGAGIRSNQFDDILNRLEKGEPVTPEELKTLGNMLERANKYTKPAKEVKDVLPKELKDVKKREKVVSFFDNAEQAALARIAARKNQLNALPIDEWADHAIVVASQIVRGTIKAATYVEDMVKLLGEEVRPVAAEIFEKAQKMVNQSSKRISDGKLHEANQIVDRLSGRKVPTAEKVMEKYINENPVSEKDIQKLRDLAKQVNELSGDDAVNADMAMQKILNSYEKSSVWDKVQALRYIAMLLNSSTQAVNALSGPIMATTGTIADVFGTMIDITLSKAMKQPRTTTLYGTNPVAFLARWLKGAKIGGKAGFNGVNPAGIAGANEIRGLTYKSLYNPLSIAERSLGAVAKGADYGAYKAVQTSEIRKMAFLDAKNKGIKGKANIDEHIQKYINNPPDEAILQADRIAKNTTFQRSDSFGGSIANFLANPPGKAKYAKPLIGAVVPFVRTPVNIASTALTLTPGGLFKGLYQLTSKSDASRREAIRSLSLGLTGTGLTSLGYALSNLGIITGANDSGNKSVDALKEQVGEGKYRFNTSAMGRYLRAMLDGKGPDGAAKAAKYQEGDKQFDYNKLQPLAFPLAAGAALNERKDKPAGNQIGGTLSDAAGSFLGMSTLKGVQDVFQPQYGGTTGEKATGLFERVATSFLKSFSPSALAQEARRQDPIQRKTSYNNGILEDTKAYFKSRTPGLSQSLPPNKTTLGKSKINAPGIVGQYLNPYKSEEAPYSEAATVIAKLIESTGDADLAPSAPAKKLTGINKLGESVSIAIPPKRYARYQEELGNKISEYIVTMPNDLTDVQKAERVKKIYSVVEEQFRKQLKAELGLRVSR